MEAGRDTIDRYVAAWLSHRIGEIFGTRITGVQSFGFFATIMGLGGDGLVPVSTMGRERFRYEEAAQALSSEEHTSELQSLMRNSYAVFCLETKSKQISTVSSKVHKD